MGNGINDNANLYMPPKQEDLLSINADPQQDTMEQPQNLNMGQLQQEMLMGQQNLNMAQPAQDMLMGQPQQVEEKKDLEDKPFNITDFLTEQAWKPPTIEELIEEKKKEVKQKENKKEDKQEVKKEQEPLSVEKTEAEQEAELEEEERLQYEAKQLNMTVSDYLLARDQQERQEQEQKKEKVSQAGKVEFEKGVNTKPGRCEKIGHKRKVRNVKNRIDTDVGVTYSAEKMLDQFDAGRAKAISDSEAAIREMKPISQKRVAIEKEQREALIQKQKEKEEKEKKENKEGKGKKKDMPVRAEKIKKVVEGFNEAENTLIELASFVPISKTSTILSDNPATCALGLKTLVDKAISHDVSANMICTVALTQNLAELRELILHVPMIKKLLDSNPDATALLDKQKLEMFENVNRMIPDLKTGMEQGLRLNGLDTMGGGYYENMSEKDVEADKKEALYQWSLANTNLHAMDSERQADMKTYGMNTNESWEKHIAYQKQTNTVTIDRFEVDASATVIVNGVKEHKDGYNKTIEMVRKTKGLASDKGLYLQMVAGTVPINATQEQIDERVESFKPENAKETVKGLVHEFLRMPFTEKLPVAESVQDADRLSDLMQLRDMLMAISALPEYFREFFEDKEYEAQRAEKKARGKLPAGEKEPTLKDKNRPFRHLLVSAEKVAKAIDTQIEFLTQLHNARPDQIDANEQLKSSAAFKASQDVYKTFVDGITKGEGAAKLKEW